MMNYTITGDRQSALRDLRRHYGPETRQFAWKMAKKFAVARTKRAKDGKKFCPQQSNWDFCLFMAEIIRRTI